jgi:MoaA/NifB/PqqE/SkfB family radical SAM enzyme/SAM-dependent methyltransferase
LPFNISEWTRIIHAQTPVYIRPESPDWFVPTPSGDSLLSDMQKNPGREPGLEEKRFLMRLPDAAEESYPGRYALLKTKTLRELWFHITDNCNMSCSHCLFSSSPQTKRELPAERVLELTAQAEKLGCRMFALTGGEPLVHKGLDRILNRMLEIESSHVAVLTNGLAVKKFFSAHRYDFNRLHLQISVDGIGKTHDKLRGKGMFASLEKSLNWLSAEGIPFTLSMCVTKSNVEEMKKVVEFAAETGASNVHFMWYFVRGRGESEQFVEPERIYPHLLKAWETGERTGVTIDNVEAVKSMIFAPCGTVHDGSTAGWESLAVGPDEKLYPSAATVGIDEISTCINNDLGLAWKKSTVLEELRKSSGKNLSTPFKLILGGGDTDHSYMHKSSFTGDDPYSSLYEKLALELICRKAAQSLQNEKPGLLLKMGDRLDRCSGHGEVALTHTNCLLAVAGNNSLAIVKDFYTEAADKAKEDILNPACYHPDIMSHIPEQFRFRGYGCGSPVMDAGITEGEHVVDLGSGRGIECFIAAKQVGRNGKVTGIDMLDPMLDHAREGQAAVAEKLGYDNMDFRKGYLETLPIDENCADLLLSNCVLNLSTDKRRTFAEMFRVLKPGGRLTVSDVVCETEPGPEIRNDDTLHGECIAGAQTQKNLCGLLEEAGFESLMMIKRFPYRTVGGHQFYSLTFSARKPIATEMVKTVYRGPLSTAVTPAGSILTPGSVAEISRQEADLLGEQLFIINEEGAVDNVFIGESCCPTPDSFDKPEANKQPEQKHANISMKTMAGCMVCGAELEYLTEYREMTCAFCGEKHEANGHCVNDHFVCDKCHSEDGMAVLPHLLKSSTEKDMIALLVKARNHPAIPTHGPEHHALVPGVIAAAYRNCGGAIDDRVIDTAVSRGSKIAGGFCGFMGVCGAAIGVGTAMSAILEATPLTASKRSIVQKGTLSALKLISEIEAPRCCQRDSWLALKAAAQASEEVLGLQLKADTHILCDQMNTNKECMGQNCPVIRNNKGNQPPVIQLLGSITDSEKKV